MCLITSRQPVFELAHKTGQTVLQQPLEELDKTAGVELLRQLGVGGADHELGEAVTDLHGHAYSLTLLGSFLVEATEHRDIRRRHEFLLHEQDSHGQHQSHADHIFAAYIRHLGESSAEVSLLHLLGFFDRPANRELLDILIGDDTQGDDLSKLVAPLSALSKPDLNRVLTRLRKLRLIDRETPSGAQTTSIVPRPPLDSHPLLRGYFSHKMRRDRTEAWTQGHRRLFEHLCETTEHQPDTIEGLQPLYQAVAHGCQAGMYQQAREDVFRDRILRGTGPGGFYSTRKLGAIGADLGAIACFFDSPWSRVTAKLTADQSWLLNEAAYYLRALGRLTEALEPLRAALKFDIEREDWMNAAQVATNLSELKLTLGHVSEALSDAEQSVTFADRSKDKRQRTIMRTTHGEALHQSGRHEDAGDRYVEAETIQKEHQPEYPRLYSMGGFRYCDLLLSKAERQAWRSCMELSVPEVAEGLWPTEGSVEKEHRQACEEITERATQTLDWGVRGNLGLLSIGVGHLTLARAALYRWLIEAGEAKAEEATTFGPTPRALTEHLAAAASRIGESGQTEFLPLVMLAQAWSRWATNPIAAVADLNEAWEIAERGPMPLCQADILLTRARLFFREDLVTAKSSLAEAGRLIKKHGYHRRDQELEDAETALQIAQEL